MHPSCLNPNIYLYKLSSRNIINKVDRIYNRDIIGRMKIARILLAGTLTLYSHLSLSQCDQREFSLLIENDSALTLGGGTDRFYSNGNEITYRCKQSLTENVKASNYASRSLSLLRSQHSVIGINRGVRLGHKIYTNSDIGLEDFEIDTERDRPVFRLAIREHIFRSGNLKRCIYIA